MRCGSNIRNTIRKWIMIKDILNVVDDVRAQDIVCYDMRGVSPYYEYVVICSGNTDRQTTAIMNHLKDYANENKISIRVEGKESGKWVLVDLGDVIVNIFIPEEREYFQLEKLWLDIPMLDINDYV